VGQRPGGTACAFLGSRLEGERIMTVLFALFALFALIVIFGLSYRIKGLKVALIATGVMFIVFSVLYAGMIYLIVNTMD
jgi:hypothetical protein